ncbi:MAG: pilus assembly protein [Planctomycetaceae bacterium]|nr:pilus assembly protein [Planctomycetaceae bacterium]MCA9066225.1 pilus assembly protein [Planctomycetaceae bacterium]
MDNLRQPSTDEKHITRRRWFLLSAFRGRRGATAVEAALVLPIFFMVVIAIIDFGRGMSASQLITSAAQQGARRGMLDGGTNTEVTNAVRDMLRTNLGIQNSDITITIQVNGVNGNVASAVENDRITVRAEVPFDRVSYGTGFFLKGKKLRGESSMRHE